MRESRTHNFVPSLKEIPLSKKNVFLILFIGSMCNGRHFGCSGGKYDGCECVVACCRVLGERLKRYWKTNLGRLALAVSVILVGGGRGKDTKNVH